MPIKKTIAIVGATGQIGAAIAKSLARIKQYNLLLMSNVQDTLFDLKTEIEKSGAASEVLVTSCAREASWEADIIIVATPYEDQNEVANTIREVATGKIVISVSNPLTNSYHKVITSLDTSAAEGLQKLLPNSKVVKTFNITSASEFLMSAVSSEPCEVFVAGNNGFAVDTVSKLLESAGFRAIVTGDLSVSRMLERMQLKLIHTAIKNNYNVLAGSKIF
jgi:predicted dinucleotide-binding enzyme